MDAPKMQVKCGVDTCEYYKQHMCFAHGLEVNPNGESNVRSSDSTCCTTFRPRQS